VFLIEPTDIPIQFCVRLDSRVPIVCQRRPTTCAWAARIAGPIAALLAMAHGARDGDALFFSREITIEGDTDAILAMRNAIDAAEIDLPYEIAGLLGPFSDAARRTLDATRPVVARLRAIAAASRGAHAT
jgi:predicted lipid carrier protein YhbT